MSEIPKDEIPDDQLMTLCRVKDRDLEENLHALTREQIQQKIEYHEKQIELLENMLTEFDF